MTNYRTVATTERLPQVANENYLTISEKGIETARFFNGTRFETAHYEGEITHWLEKVADNNDVSDGYHTFRELYEFRKMFNAALFNEWASQGKYNVHKSVRHHDGEYCFGEDSGWFIVVAILPTGQISNHYERKDWDLFNIPAKDRAMFEFDGHTGADVIERLKTI
jgi:hypothetical protein